MTVLEQIQMYSRLISSEFLSGSTVVVLSQIRGELIERDNTEMFGPLVPRNAEVSEYQDSITECANPECKELGFMERDNGLAYCLECW